MAPSRQGEKLFRLIEFERTQYLFNVLKNRERNWPCHSLLAEDQISSRLSVSANIGVGQMRKSRNLPQVPMHLGVVIFAIFLIAPHIHASTIIAASTSRSDVAAAIASAADGDTVQIPAGNSTWSSTLTITKAITLKGAGTNNTFIRYHGNILDLSPSNDLPARVSGIYFDLFPFQNGNGGDISAIRVDSTITNLRIDHCYFRGGKRTLFFPAKSYGVTDHCTFLDSNLDASPTMAGSDFGNTSWREPIQPGTTKTMVIEDCQFVRDDAMTDDPNEVIYGWIGARCCFRYNTVLQTATQRPLAAIDAHGYNSGWGRGTRFYEVYNNTFHCAYTYRFCALRGGTHIFYNNKFIEDQSSSAAVMALYNEGLMHNWPATTQDNITGSFFWGNTYNGSPIGAEVDPSSTGAVVINRDYFNRAIQSGDPWHPYSPLVYPHPRVTAEDTPAKVPAPKNLRFAAGN
jgi:hypothetical protein